MTAPSPSSRIKAGVIQMRSTDDLEGNLRSAESLIRGAAGEGAALVVAPECFAFLGPEEGKLKVAEPLPQGGPILQRFRDLARTLGVELVLGGFWAQGARPEQVFKSCVHLRADGELAAVYRKIHLFDVQLADGTALQESASVEAGEQVVVTSTALGPLGLSICYDLRFPELFRRLVDQGAIALAVPAAFTLTTGKDHWHVLLRARAIESQSYVLAAAQTGRHFGQRVSYGHACIIDPWGTVLADCGEDEGYALAWIDRGQVDKVRRSLPSLQHRRLG